MRVYQLLPTLSFGDAIGNDVRALEKVIRDMGYRTAIFAEVIDPRLPAGTAQPVRKMPRPNPEDVVIFHLSTGSTLTKFFAGLHCRRLMIYHNITPAHFFRGYNEDLRRLCEEGRSDAAFLADKVDGCMADSAYNAQELRALGYACPITVRPILIPFADYTAPPDGDLLAHYENDGYTNLVFVGRIAPNKRQEDVIRTFYFYKKYCNPRSRLFLVGSYGGLESYYHRLRRYVGALELDNVVFTGHISFPAILAYYHLSDLFLCMSEHEGFCVPLVESMYFGIPIVARNTSAIGDTLGGSGFLLDSNDPLEGAFAVHRILSDTDLRREIIAGQRRRQQDFAYPVIRKQFEHQLRQFILETPA